MSTPRLWARYPKYHFSESPQMCPGATELTLIPRGPNSVARLCAIASSAALVSLYGPILSCEKRTTMELIITTEPAASASAGVNSLVSRRAAMTFASKLALRASRLTSPRALMGGMASALYTSASTRPNPSSAASARWSAAAASARSVGTASPRRPSPVISLATSSSRAGRARGQHHVRPFPGAGQRDGAPQPGADAGHYDDLVLQQHQP